MFKSPAKVTSHKSTFREAMLEVNSTPMGRTVTAIPVCIIIKIPG